MVSPPLPIEKPPKKSTYKFFQPSAIFRKVRAAFTDAGRKKKKIYEDTSILIQRL